jgi:DNA-directed RNA polymerase specialized sigma24 family protein
MQPLTAVTRAAAKAASASQNRDDAIRAAHANGYSIRAIAAAAGLSSTRVHQIIHGR